MALRFRLATVRGILVMGVHRGIRSSEGGQGNVCLFGGGRARRGGVRPGGQSGSGSGSATVPRPPGEEAVRRNKRICIAATRSQSGDGTRTKYMRSHHR